MQKTTDHYDFRELRRSPSGSVCAHFHVENAGGLSRDELLAFNVIEARVLLWDDLMQHEPAIIRRDPAGFANYRQYVRALVEGLRQQVC